MATIYPLTAPDIISIVFAFIILTLFGLISLSIFHRYKIHKNKTLLIYAIIFSLFSTPWWPVIISFIVNIITGGLRLDPLIYFFIAHGFLPVTMYFWLIVFIELLSLNNKKLILISYLMIVVIIEIITYIFIIIDSNSVIILIGAVGAIMGPMANPRATIVVIVMLFTGFLFFSNTRRSSSREIQVKANFIFIGNLLYLVGGLLYVIIKEHYIFSIITFFSLIIFYIGMVMPDWSKKLFIERHTFNNKIALFIVIILLTILIILFFSSFFIGSWTYI